MTVRLEPLTADNWREAIALEIASDQWRYLDSESLLHFVAEGNFHPTYKTHAIYSDDMMVGIVSFGYEPADPSRWWIPLIVVAHEHQGKGYGRAAMLAVIDRIRQEAPECEHLGLAYKPDNLVAERLYLSLGFEPAAAPDDKGEVPAWLRMR